MSLLSRQFSINRRLLKGLVMILNHPFLDGNKRTSLAVLYEFLKQNGLRLSATEQQLIELPLKVERKDLSLEQIAKWLEEHTKKVRKLK